MTESSVSIISYTSRNGFADSGEAWSDGESTEALCARLGLEPHPHCDGADVGVPGYTVAVHRSKSRSNRWHALLMVHDYDRADGILVASLPDMIELRAKLAPLAQLHAIDRLSELVDMAGKAFQAWHGHSHVRGCRHCDPAGYELRVRARGDASPKGPTGPAAAASIPFGIAISKTKD